MASTTDTQIRDRAQTLMDKGHLDFKVLAATKGKIFTVYIVQVPMVASRSGIWGWVRKAATGRWGIPTAFGRDLCTAVRRQKAEATPDNDAPHLVYISVRNDETGMPPRNLVVSSKGLREDICVAVQEAILRNRQPLQRLTEWIRRL